MPQLKWHLNIVAIEERLKEIPRSPGVYLHKDAAGKVIYVGKAKNLRSRVRSYFRARPFDRKTDALVENIVDLEFIVTDNEVEALILEATLVKQHKPRYNIKLQDDKSYPHLKLTINEPFPKVVITRRVQRDGALYFGPFLPASLARRTIDLINRTFGFYGQDSWRIRPNVTINYGLRYDIELTQLTPAPSLSSPTLSLSSEQVAAALEGGLVTNAVNIPVIGADDLEVLGPFIPLTASLARLAMELSFSEQTERRAELSGEAVEIAREADDTSGLGFALVARHWSLWGPQNVQERLQTVARGHPLERLHDQHLVIARDVARLEQRRDLVLARGHLVVPGLDRHTQAVQLRFRFRHERQDARRNGAEVVVLELLPLGRLGAEQGSLAGQQIRPPVEELPVHQEVLLLRAHRRNDSGDACVGAEDPQDAKGLLG